MLFQKENIYELDLCLRDDLYTECPSSRYVTGWRNVLDLEQTSSIL